MKHKERIMAMNEITTQGSAEISILGDLAKEAQHYARGVVTNMLQLGRVLTEAKPLVKHGEWETWIAENAGCSERYAQMFMQAYKRFGENPAIAQLHERSKVFKLLSLPVGTEEQFLADNDVSAMSSREVDEAVRKVREEMELQLDREKKARKAAENRAAELENEVDRVPDHIMDDLMQKQNTIEQQQREIDRITIDEHAALQEAQRLRRENAGLQREISEQNAVIEETQQEYDRMRRDLRTLQSAAAKGDAERVPVDELTLDVLAGAVRQFIGTCARMPYMRHAFSTMPLYEKNRYDEFLRTVEGWCRESRSAMNTIAYEEVEIRG